MGCVSSKSSAVDESPLDNGEAENNSTAARKPVGPAKELKERAFSISNVATEPESDGRAEVKRPRLSRVLSCGCKLSKSKPSATAKTRDPKIYEVSSLLGRAGTAGLGKAVEVLDTLGSSMTSLNIGAGFVAGVTMKGCEISILAFEVANTIVKGRNLMHSLSTENIKHIKGYVLKSEAIQLLISKDMGELLRIAAMDKREELKIFSEEVVRFGNLCKDPQWHNLDRYFEKFSSEITPQKQLKEKAISIMQQLMTSAECTADLYHELNVLERFEQAYRKPLKGGISKFAQRGDITVGPEVKSQREHVNSLKEKSLWSNTLEEVMDKIVDIVHFLHLEFHEAFGTTAVDDSNQSQKESSHQRLGPAGLAYHYANIISQIDRLASGYGYDPQNLRDALYLGLPPNIKAALRLKLRSLPVNEKLTTSQINTKMEKTLCWLVQMANNTKRAHHGLGWVVEWSNSRTERHHEPSENADFIRSETLHHASKEKTDECIVDLIVLLHRYTSLCKEKRNGITPLTISTVFSPTREANPVSPPNMASTPTCKLTQEDVEMLLKCRKLTPGISKSQEFDTARKRSIKQNRRRLFNLM